MADAVRRFGSSARHCYRDPGDTARYGYYVVQLTKADLSHNRDILTDIIQRASGLKSETAQDEPEPIL